MPKLTLLDMVQDILSEMDSDDSNSINDSDEAYQIARIIKNSYYEIITAKNYNYFDKTHTFSSSSDSTKPTKLTIPNNVVYVHWFKYNDIKVTYKTPEEFLVLASGLSSNYYTVTDDTGITYKVGTKSKPSYWTSFDETNVICSSYDSSVDSTLQSSKTKVFSQIEPEFALTDSFVPDLPLNMFPQLLEESKSTAFAHIKQMPSNKAEQKASRQRARVAQKGVVNNGVKYPNYGR